ncbi:MAG: M28 family peptidase, partial [Verrucomicrobia bacterium]|nr:M28 family peptidase [Verrucomicrobiota bacterium]
MLSEKLVPRSHKHTRNLDQCADYIASHFKKAGATVALQEYEVKGRGYKNVIATFGPPTASRIVVGAHYDAFREHPGADDNASGVAGLIELA